MAKEKFELNGRPSKIWVVKERGDEWEDSNIVGAFPHDPSKEEMEAAVRFEFISNAKRMGCSTVLPEEIEEHLENLREAAKDTDAPFDKGIWAEEVDLHDQFKTKVD